MEDSPTIAFEIDIIIAQRTATKHLINFWIKSGNHASDRLFAALSQLGGLDLMTHFLAETDVTVTEVDDWMLGLNLPDAETCLELLQHFVTAIDTEISKLKSRRTTITTVDDEGIPPAELGEAVVVSFSRPVGTADDMPLADIPGYLDDLSIRSRTALKNENVWTLDELLEYEQRKVHRENGRNWHQAIVKIPNIGKTCRADIYAFLVKNGCRPTFQEPKS